MNATDTGSLESLAREALEYFELAERESECVRYWRTIDGAPEWIGELCREAHGDMLPDDWRYSAIVGALEAISEGAEDGHEFADGHVDVYTGSRYEWLGSNLSREQYCEDAREEGLIGEGASISEQIGVGQYCEALEVFASVRDSLEAHGLELLNG